MPRTLARTLDPVELAERQIAIDRERTRRFPELLVRKFQRMSASPLAYLRGAAPLFYEILASRADLAEGPAGEGWITGDMHLENFGAYRPDPVEVTGGEQRGKKGEKKSGKSGKKRSDNVVFDLNDFDDAIVGPWRFDLVRLTTSLLLGGRELGASGVVALSLADRLLDAWASAAFDDAPLPEAPRPVRLLEEQVRSRSRAELLDARTHRQRGRRSFVRGPRYADLPAPVLAKVPKAFDRYMMSLPKRDRPQKGSLEILDAALRIAGTGSLGALRVAVLVQGKGGDDGQWIFDLKEQGDPSALEVLGTPREIADLAPAERVVTALEACVARPPRMVGTTRLAGASMLARKLTPQEDKLNLRRLDRADLPDLACYLGALLGRAHRRAATKPPRSRWSTSDLAGVRDRAIALAGVHEAIYLALCERVRHLLPLTASSAVPGAVAPASPAARR